MNIAVPKYDRVLVLVQRESDIILILGGKLWKGKPHSPSYSDAPGRVEPFVSRSLVMEKRK